MIYLTCAHHGKPRLHWRINKTDPQAQIMPHACTYACGYWNYYLVYLIHFPLQRYTKRPKILVLYICVRSSTAQVIQYWVQLVWFSVTHPMMSWVSPMCVETSTKLTVSKNTTEDTNPKIFVWVQWWPIHRRFEPSTKTSQRGPKEPTMNRFLWMMQWWPHRNPMKSSQRTHDENPQKSKYETCNDIDPSKPEQNLFRKPMTKQFVWVQRCVTAWRPGRNPPKEPMTN